MSLLVDVCRQSIAFESLAELTACLRAIAADPEVTVVRVKNRLDPAYDSADSAGYRDVALNLRIVSAAAQDLGVETHVCEVQLLLKSFAELKVPITLLPNHPCVSERITIGMPMVDGASWEDEYCNVASVFAVLHLFSGSKSDLIVCPF